MMFVPLTAVLAATVLLSGCASTKMRRVSGDDFMARAGQIEQINSAHWTTYIGSSGKRAYLEFGYPAYIGGGVRTVVFWTHLTELPADISHKLTVGAPPWNLWSERKGNVATPGDLSK